ncbi:uncharacterized protein LOC123311469 [Coccinella septempunctata]|uniref:uncharacterized protein LOC123311469 n=1 Tax=Coccinella septempunctata TaxID=41139 RepID=UPI001D05DBA9|nr:uncharacterized protein LOC123311469 [Coccinella septempunctata]
MIEIRILFFVALYSTTTSSHPYFDGFSRNPFNQGYGLFNYANQIPYNTYLPSFPEPDLTFYQSQHQTLNLIAETPQVIGTTFSIVPMFAIPRDNVNMVSSADILGVSQKKPMLTIRTESNSLLQCVPGVRIELEQPMWIYALKKTSIVFPSEILIYHGGYRIPLKVGAVLAPVTQDSFFFNQVPVEVRVVYAVPVPSKPIRVETVTTTQQVQNTVFETVDNQAVVVDANEFEGGQGNISGVFDNPKNVTVVEFPNNVASPTLPVADEDEELVNRNPPQVLAPAGIVQSTQPEIVIEPFHNSKESPVLTQLKEEKLKQKLKIRDVQGQIQNATHPPSSDV